MLHVSRLQIAPVKSLASVTVPRVYVDREGVAEDRRLYLLGQDGRVVTLREHPQLSQVVPTLDLARATLEIVLPDGSLGTARLDELGEPVTATLFGKDRPGRVVKSGLTDHLSDYVGEPLRLVLADRTGTGWDEGPVSLVSRASMAALEPPGDAASQARRFRMLLEVEGAGVFEEDTWTGSRVAVGEAVLRISQPLGRCVIITQPPEADGTAWPGLKRLAAERGAERLSLGVVADVELPGAVALGDAVELLDLAAAEPV